MSEIELAAVFLIGLIVGAYGAYLAHPIIEGGVALMKLQKAENKRIELEEAKTKNAETNASTQPAATQTTPRPTQEQNH